jgi:hypothetical protein
LTNQQEKPSIQVTHLSIGENGKLAEMNYGKPVGHAKRLAGPGWREYVNTKAGTVGAENQAHNKKQPVVG